MRNYFLPLLVLIFTAACGPRDVAVGDRNGSVNPNGKVDKTKTYVVTEDGDRSPSCPEDFSDQKFIASSEEFDEQIFSGDVTAIISAGNRNCYRLGTEVALQNKTKEEPDAPIRGKLKITRVEVIPATSLTKKHAAAMGMTLSEAKTAADELISAAKEKPKDKGGFDPAGMINITFFEVVGDGEPAVLPPVEILVFDVLGKMAPTCPADFTPSKSLDIPAEKDQSIIDGKLIGSIAAGDRNCFEIGSIISLKAKGPDTPERAKLKIAWVEIVPVAKLNQDHASILNMALDEVKTASATLIKDAKFDAKGIVNITVFEYVPPAQ